MKLRTPLMLSASVVAGFFWNPASKVHGVVIHLIAPSLLGVIVAALWRQSSARWQFLLVLLSLGVGELIRLIIYCVRADAWPSITADSVTQLAIAISAALQLFIAGAAWGLARLFFRRHERREA